MEQPVEPFDLMRMLVGEQPPLFFAEIVLRTLIVYAYTFGLVRWLGGRSVAQLSVIEFLLVIALGSAVGDAMFYPDVPLLHAMLVITIVVLINKFIDTMLARVPASERIFDASPVEVVRNGELLNDGLIKAGYGPQEIIEQLRMQGIRNLGEVETAILESNGHMSVFKLKKPNKGMALLPLADARSEATSNFRTAKRSRGKGKATG
ncbi:MAG TPA: YetF domain-containing protein, partial [Rhizobiaceae bacterium]|nr:YetF domain-containing protein [Rhizobiaceae bacterium]